jgi:hypothetical protein
MEYFVNVTFVMNNLTSFHLGLDVTALVVAEKQS